MRGNDETLIAEAGRRLAAAAPDAQVILFGSDARGEVNQHSDVDFLVVEPEVTNGAEESVRLRRTLRDLRMPADVIVVVATTTTAGGRRAVALSTQLFPRAV